jgi:hypothetical protein
MLYAYMRRGDYYQHKQSYDEAISDLTHAIRLDSTVSPKLGALELLQVTVIRSLSLRRSPAHFDRFRPLTDRNRLDP